MPAPATVDDLVKLIRKSGMIDEPRLDAHLERLRLAGPIPADVRKLAGGMVRDGLLTYFQAEQFMLGKWRGFTIGKYKLLERIGFGGMGQVFLCEHMYMRRRVAIKVLPPAKAEEPAALGRFYREARAAAALDHPNIVRTHDIDQDGNLHFLVMEYVDGASLLEIIKKRGPLPIERACHYVWQAAQGLDHAFRVGVIHRDIKPGNVLVDRFGVAKILDMGLAKFYHSDDDMLTKKYDEKSVLGTADYVAPEQTINSHEVDVRADIYSLGATFYYLLAGHPPFPDGTVSQKLIAHQTRRPTPIQRLRPEVPDALALAVDRLMAKAVQDRFQTPAEVCEALAPFVPTQVPAPPDDEMPVLSPAAREPSSVPVMAGANSGSFRQDSAVLRAEYLQRSGRLSPSGKMRAPTPALPRAGGSANLPPAYDPPPMIAPTATAIIPAAPARPSQETLNLAESTDRTAAPVPHRGPRKSRHAVPEPTDSRPGLNPVLKIIMESILAFGVCLVLWFIFRPS